MILAAPLTDAEYALLLPFLSTGTGRPPADRRRTLDAIFHVVMTRCIWARPTLASIHLPKPALSETLQKLTIRLFENPYRLHHRVSGLLGRLMRFAGGRRDLWRTR